MGHNDEVISATFYLTRACNIDCSYCRIWDNHFPNELSLEQKKEAIRILWEDVKAGFIILFGGEPLTLGDDLVEIVRYCGEIGVRYAITSNSLLLTPEMAQRLVAAGLQNWSISLDYITHLERDPIGAKSHKGLRDLAMLRHMGVGDLFATTTITHNNIKEILPIVEYCSENDYWVVVTPLHHQKSPDYFFASPQEAMPGMALTDDDIEELKPIMQKLIKMKQDGYLIHNDIEYLEDFTRYAKNLDWFCEGMSSMVVDADGKIKTCLHFNHIQGWTIFDLSVGIFRKEFFNRYSGKHPCQGCFWDCRYQAEHWREVDPEQGRKVFQHA